VVCFYGHINEPKGSIRGREVLTSWKTITSPQYVCVIQSGHLIVSVGESNHETTYILPWNFDENCKKVLQKCYCSKICSEYCMYLFLKLYVYFNVGTVVPSEVIIFNWWHKRTKRKNAVCMLLITIVHKIKKVCIFLKLKL